jgi:hypothetical protein
MHRPESQQEVLPALLVYQNFQLAVAAPIDLYRLNYCPCIPDAFLSKHAKENHLPLHDSAGNSRLNTLLNSSAKT